MASRALVCCKGVSLSYKSASAVITSGLLLLVCQHVQTLFLLGDKVQRASHGHNDFAAHPSLVLGVHVTAEGVALLAAGVALLPQAVRLPTKILATSKLNSVRLIQGFMKESL